jgi:hypothetical protein
VCQTARNAVDIALCLTSTLPYSRDLLLELLHPRLGKPVLSLDYLMDTIVTKLKPLDWEVFWNKQKNNTQVLKVSLQAVCRGWRGGGVTIVVYLCYLVSVSKQECVT